MAFTSFCVFEYAQANICYDNEIYFCEILSQTISLLVQVDLFHFVHQLNGIFQWIAALDPFLYSVLPTSALYCLF